MRSVAWLAVVLVIACSGGSSSPSPPAVKTSAAKATLAPATVPPLGSQRLDGGCGMTGVYRGGILPGWATVNAPNLGYVIATPGTALGYLFSYPLTAGAEAQNKILWYVGAPRNGSNLTAQGHPLGGDTPTATFSKGADSFPGEIYPTGPTVPSTGCWRFTLTWQDGAQRTEVDLLFS